MSFTLIKAREILARRLSWGHDDESAECLAAGIEEYAGIMRKDAEEAVSNADRFADERDAAQARVKEFESALEQAAAWEWRDAMIRSWPTCDGVPQNINFGGYFFTAVVEGERVVASMVKPCTT